MRKDERICIDCNRKYRVKKHDRRSKRCPECAKKRHKLQMIDFMEKKQSLGTPATMDLSFNGVKDELFRIRNNLKGNWLYNPDKGAKELIDKMSYNPNSKSKYEVNLDKMVYDTNKKCIKEVLE